MRPEVSPNPCLEFEAVTNAVLDRELPPSALESPHASECPACRELAGSVQMLLSALATPLPAPPDGFAFRVVSAAVRDRKRQLRLRWAKRAGGLAVAAAVLFAVYLGTKPPTVAPDVAVNVPKPEPIPSPKPARVSDKLAEAGSAFTAITQRTADEALTPTRNLLPTTETVSLPHVPEIVPPTDPLDQLPSAARAGLEPVTSSAKRAWNVFVRDVVPGKGSS